MQDFDPRKDEDRAYLAAALTAYALGLKTEAILSRQRRSPAEARGRQIAMYLLREEAGLPLSAIGRFMGGKNHTTVLHAHQRISSQITVDPHIRRDVFNLREALTNA